MKPQRTTTVSVRRPYATKHQLKIFHKVYDLHDDMEQTMYTDQTGRFPTKSYKGMQYIMVLVELDSHAILVEAMRDRTSGEMIQAYQILMDRLKKTRFQTKNAYFGQ